MQSAPQLTCNHFSLTNYIISKQWPSRSSAIPNPKNYFLRTLPQLQRAQIAPGENFSSHASASSRLKHCYTSLPPHERSPINELLTCVILETVTPNEYARNKDALPPSPWKKKKNRAKNTPRPCSNSTNNMRASESRPFFSPLAVCARALARDYRNSRHFFIVIDRSRTRSLLLLLLLLPPPSEREIEYGESFFPITRTSTFVPRWR